MLTRKAHQEAGKELPEKWLEKLKKLLNQVFGEVSQHEKKSFEVFGKVFPDEVWLATSFLDPSDQTSAPVTYLVSADLVSDQKMETVIDNLIDSIGLFYDVYFSSPDWDDFSLEWTEFEIKKEKFYYRSTRENISLTLMADKLLEGDQD